MRAGRTRVVGCELLSIYIKVFCDHFRRLDSLRCCLPFLFLPELFEPFSKIFQEV